MQLILNCVLFCCILLLCAFCFSVGLLLGYRRKTAHKRKLETIPLTEEQERKVNRQKREEENFWNYDGSPQDVI